MWNLFQVVLYSLALFTVWVRYITRRILFPTFSQFIQVCTRMWRYSPSSTMSIVLTNLCFHVLSLSFVFYFFPFLCARFFSLIYTLIIVFSLRQRFTSILLFFFFYTFSSVKSFSLSWLSSLFSWINSFFGFNQ